MPANDSQTLTDLHLDYTIPDDLNFTDYLNRCQTLILKARPQATPDILAANMPFELRPNTTAKIKSGALLIHGLLETPYAMQDIGRHLQTQGMLVRSILLPGHGAVSGSLLNVTYQDWLDTVKYGMQSLAKEVDRIFLVGNSTGGSLALYHALQANPKIAGIILFAPALKIRSPLAFATNWLRHLGTMWERAKWYLILEENDYAKYQSITFNAAYQVYRLGQEVLKLLANQQIICPILIALSQDDKTIASQTTLTYFQQTKNVKNQMILYTHTPNAWTDTRITLRAAAYPTLNIVNISHIAIPIAPSNPRYGMQGNYLYASRVAEKNNIIYGSFNKAEIMLHELLCKWHLTQTHYQNVSFNPDFDFLAQTISHFIENI